jgi:hypothetical protein
LPRAGARARPPRVVGGGVVGGRRGAASTRLGMFDQLSSALTEVARNFGGKQR